MKKEKILLLKYTCPSFDRTLSLHNLFLIFDLHFRKIVLNIKPIHMYQKDFNFYYYHHQHNESNKSLYLSMQIKCRNKSWKIEYIIVWGGMYFSTRNSSANCLPMETVSSKVLMWKSLETSAFPDNMARSSNSVQRSQWGVSSWWILVRFICYG